MGVKLGVTRNEKHKLRVFLGTVERRVFRPRGKGALRIIPIKSCIVCTLH